MRQKSKKDIEGEQALERTLTNLLGYIKEEIRRGNAQAAADHTKTAVLAVLRTRKWEIARQRKCLPDTAWPIARVEILGVEPVEQEMKEAA